MKIIPILVDDRLMKVRFYPRDIGMFRNGDFDFNYNPTLLVCKTITNYKDFNDRAELTGYLKTRGVRLDDYEYPLTFESDQHHLYGNGYSVKQWTHLGFMVEL